MAIFNLQVNLLQSFEEFRVCRCQQNHHGSMVGFLYVTRKIAGDDRAGVENMQLLNTIMFFLEGFEQM